jgi:D-alanyl-D-alanine carboxypeptidase
VGDPLEGVLRAKTGQIDGVVGLVGVIDGPRARHFAFVANGDFSSAVGHGLQDEVARRVAAAPALDASAVPGPTG